MRFRGGYSLKQAPLLQVRARHFSSSQQLAQRSKTEGSCYQECQERFIGFAFPGFSRSMNIGLWKGWRNEPDNQKHAKESLESIADPATKRVLTRPSITWSQNIKDWETRRKSRSSPEQWLGDDGNDEDNKMKMTTLKWRMSFETHCWAGNHIV